MTHLRKIMLEEMQRRNFADTTIWHYLSFVERFARHFGNTHQLVESPVFNM